MNQIWIEAESFITKGGWVTDTQSMEMIHSAYLMAHGMGIPVEDAVTEFSVAESSHYFVWVLTRDWTAVWNVKDSAGKFKLKIDSTELPEILGTNGKDWGFQIAGRIYLEKGTHSLSLHDLTGFNGRCDAIYLTNEAKIPDSSPKAIEEMRKTLNWHEIKEHPTTYDLIVAGGGVAGICTALSAIRSGLNVALINDRPMLGGCNSSEIRVCMGGQIKLPPYDHLGDVVREIAPVMGHPTIYKEEYFEDFRKKAAFEVPSYPCGKHDLLLNEAVTAIEQKDNTITAVICINTLTGKKTRIKAPLFSDCTGDGILARLGGAEVMYGNDAESDFGESLAPKNHKNLVMGHSIRWYSVQQPAPCSFPDLDWNLTFDENSYLNCYCGNWEQETGFTRNMATEAEYIRDYGLRAIYSNWSYQKNHCPEKERFADRKMEWVSPFGGKREGYRVKGDYVLSQRDIEEQIVHEDATADITWGIDIHYPEPINQEIFGEAFRSFAYHRSMPAKCPVPYRCLYSKDIPNLFIGGRLVSTSHVAFSAVRVMRTLGMLGEVVGLAASLCKKHRCQPADIYKTYLEELKLLMTQGVPIPDAFACGGLGDAESYHFKDIGWWRLHDGSCADDSHQPKKADPKEVEKFNYCVNALGIHHKYPVPKTWK